MQAVTPSFSRLQHQRPGYGYAGVPDPWEALGEPEDDGIYWMDTDTGEHRLIISIAQIANLQRDERFDGKIHRYRQGPVGWPRPIERNQDVLHRNPPRTR